MKHIHHIKPKHMGGGNEPSNLMLVSVQEHAELHLALYLEYGYYDDWIAYQCLSGQITNAEANRLNKLGDRNPAKRDDVRAKISAAAKHQSNNAKNYIITFTNGTQCTIKNLAKWARDNGYTYHCLKNKVSNNTKGAHRDIVSIQLQ